MPNWSGLYKENYSLLVNRSPLGAQVSKILKRRGLRRIKEIIDTDAIQTRSGNTASDSYTQIQAVATPGAQNSQGGKRNVVAKTVINQSTNSATSAEVRDELITPGVQKAYTPDLSGNAPGLRARVK
jgi:hypothetical protein